MHRSLLHNDGVLDASQKDLSAGQVGLLNGWGVFSTIRVADGILFALERHWERMRRDAARMRGPFPDHPRWLKTRLIRLIEANMSPNATLHVVVVANRDGLYAAPNLDLACDLITF